MGDVKILMLVSNQKSQYWSRQLDQTTNLTGKKVSKIDKMARKRPKFSGACGGLTGGGQSLKYGRLLKTFDG